jgi:hypothetical protein
MLSAVAAPGVRRARPARKEGIMKVQDFAYQVAIRTIALLEDTQHYKIPEALRKEVTEKILGEVDDLIKKSK